MITKIDDFSRWTDRVALISGAGSELGIGSAIARRLTREDMCLLITASSERIRRRAEELSTCGHDVRAASADLTDEAQVQGPLDWAEVQWGRVDILVNNAGVAQLDSVEPFSAVEATPLRDWQLPLSRNLTSAFPLTRGLLPGMRERGYGRIVNITSTTGTRGNNPGEAAYGATKAGLVGWSMGLALGVTKSGITVNSIAPDWIATASSTTEERQAALTSPSRRAGRPEEVATTVVFLASPEANFVNGELLVMDDGNCLIENKRS